jgi:hypothetical protein
MWEVRGRKPFAAGKFRNSPTDVKFDTREVPLNAALTYVGEWLLVVRGCAGRDDDGDWCYEDLPALHFRR